MLIKKNREHFKKAMKTRAHNDKIIKSMHKNKIRDKTLQRELSSEDADCHNVLEFLKLLKCKNKALPTKIFQLITLEDWADVVKRSKKNSVSSVFQREHV